MYFYRIPITSVNSPFDSLTRVTQVTNEPKSIVILIGFGLKSDQNPFLLLAL